MLTKDLDNFGGIDWCKASVEDLRKAARTWNKEDKTTKSISGCATFLLM